MSRNQSRQPDSSLATRDYQTASELTDFSHTSRQRPQIVSRDLIARRASLKDTRLTCLARRVSEHRYIVQSKGNSEEQPTSLDAKYNSLDIGILVTAIFSQTLPRRSGQDLATRLPRLEFCYFQCRAQTPFDFSESHAVTGYIYNLHILTVKPQPTVL